MIELLFNDLASIVNWQSLYYNIKSLSTDLLLANIPICIQKQNSMGRK
jgi:hypothetical protein